MCWIVESRICWDNKKNIVVFKFRCHVSNLSIFICCFDENYLFQYKSTLPQYFILLAVLFFHNCNSHSVHQICSLYKSLNRENKGMFKKSAKAYTEKINSSKYYRWQKFLLRRNYSIHLSRPSPLKNEIRSNPLSLFILFVDIWV